MLADTVLADQKCKVMKAYRVVVQASSITTRHTFQDAAYLATVN
jgi:hypothetical protein